MRIRSFVLSSLVALAAAGLQGQQPAQSCNGQTCTFTLNFDDGYAQLTNTTGAPYSGQVQNSNTQTLPNGTHTSSQVSGAMIYRDSKGRVRTERHAYPPAPLDRSDRPANPNDFVIAEIHDSVARFEYVLDPVNRVAHRKPFKPEASWKWDPSQITNMKTTCGQAGAGATVQLLGTQTVSGVTAYGCKTTFTRATPDGKDISSTGEDWYDPASGQLVSSISTANDRSQTRTLANYSNSEPAASLFQIPDGYQTVDETGPFQVVHTQIGPGGTSSGMHGPQLSGDCQEGTCQVTFDPGNMPAINALTDAPYGGREIVASVLDNGTHIGNPNGRGEYRDSYGRVRMDPGPGQLRGGMPVGTQLPSFVQIEDAVGGYIYILDSATQTGYRIKAAFRPIPFQPNPNMGPQAGTHTTPSGETQVVENLGPETISGVSAVGQRRTDTYPPGTYNNNDKTIATMSESWIDPKTGVSILTRNNGVRQDITMSMPDYKEGDPDPTLFQIPADYKVVDETGKFSFNASVVNRP